MRVKVSVLMSAYNASATIDEAIQSVLSQRGISFELCIWDDASTDKTWSRIESYRRDPRIRAWHLGRHQGAQRVWNKLIRLACGEYLSVFDADDVMLPGHLQRSAQILDQAPRVGVVYGDYWLIEGHPTDRKRRCHVPGPQEAWDLLLGQGHPGTMVRRRLLCALGGYRARFPLEDCDLFLRLAEVTEFQRRRGRLTFIKRVRPASLFKRAPPQDRYQMTLRIRREAIYRRYRRSC